MKDFKVLWTNTWKCAIYFDLRFEAMIFCNKAFRRSCFWGETPSAGDVAGECSSAQNDRSYTVYIYTDIYIYIYRYIYIYIYIVTLYKVNFKKKTGMQILPRSRNENSLWAQKHFWGFKANSSNNFGTSCCSPKDSSAQRTEYLLCSAPAPPMKCFIHQHRAVPLKDLLTMCLRCILGPNIFWGVWTSEVLDWYPPVHKLACVKVALLEGRSSEHWSRKATNGHW